MLTQWSYVFLALTHRLMQNNIYIHAVLMISSSRPLFEKRYPLTYDLKQRGWIVLKSHGFHEEYTIARRLKVSVMCCIFKKWNCDAWHVHGQILLQWNFQLSKNVSLIYQTKLIIRYHMISNVIYIINMLQISDHQIMSVIIDVANHGNVIMPFCMRIYLAPWLLNITLMLHM